jgi:RHS repeat-associated protein
MPTARSGLSAVIANNRIYAVGGYNGNYLKTVEEYDPNTNCWKTRSVMPTARSELSVVNVDGLIYAIGGKNSSALSTVEVYDPITNSWTSAANLPTARYALGAAVNQGKIYAIGGFDGNNYFSTVEEYDPVNNNWTVKANTINARAYFGIVGFAGGIYLLDGCNSTGYLDTLEKYNPGIIMWQTRENIMPAARDALGAAEADGNIYVVGGHNAQSLSTVVAYNPKENKATAKTNMQFPRENLGVAAVNGKIYAIGGYDGSSGNSLNKVEEYNPATNSWTAKTSLLIARSHLGAAAVNGKIYAIGGSNNGNCLNTVEEYDPLTNTWCLKSPMPTARKSLAVAAVSGKIYAVGGSNNVNDLKITEVYDPLTDTWTSCTDMPTARKDLGAVALNGKIFALGGYDSVNSCTLNNVQEYDPSTNTWRIEAGMIAARKGFGAAAVNGKIYVLGGYPNNRHVLEGSFPESSIGSINELIHFGESRVNLSGNFSRTYTDLQLKTPGFSMDLTRTYNSRDYRFKDYGFGTGWSLGFEGTAYDYLNLHKQEIVRLPNGSAMTFTINPDGTYTADDSRATLVKQTDGSLILTTKDQYSYRFNGSYNGYLNWMKDRNGNTITITLGPYGEVEKVSDQFGRAYTFEHGNLYNRLITKIIDPLGRSMTYTYDADKRLIKVTDPMGKNTNYTYMKRTGGTMGYLSEIRDNDNNLIESVDYDNYGGEKNVRISRLTDAYGNIKTYQYDTEFLKLTTADNNDREQITWYDSSLYPIQVQDPDGRRSTTVYSVDENRINKFGEAISTTDRNGNKTIYNRDSNGNITKIYNPDGSYKAFTYDNKNNKLSERDEAGKYTFYVYDNNKVNLVKKTQPLNGTDQYTTGCDESKFAITSYNYSTDADVAGYYLKGESPGIDIFDGGSLRGITCIYTNVPVTGNSVETIRLNKGYSSPMITSTAMSLNTNTTYIVEFDYWAGADNVMFACDLSPDDLPQINLLAKTTLQHYEWEVSSASSNMGNARLRFFNDITIPNPADIYITNVKLYKANGYRNKGLLKSETDPNGHITTYTYNIYGDIRTVKDAENNITRNVYNILGWKTGIVSPKGYITTFDYDRNGNLEKETLNGGEVTRITYDNMGRKTKVVSANLYNSALDNLTAHTYSGDHGYRFTYYPSGKVKTQKDPAGNVTSYIYDVYGNIITETKPNGSIIENTYDSLNRLIMVKYREDAAATPLTLTSYTYLILTNGNTQKTETRYLDDSHTAVTISTFNYKNNLIRQDNPDGTYKTTSYNANGTINYTTDERGFKTYYRYDGLNQNTEQWAPAAVNNNTVLYSYSNIIYDKTGNVVTVNTGKTPVSLYGVPTDFITQTKAYYDNNKLKSETDSAARRTDYFYDSDGNLSKKDVYTGSTTKNVIEYVNNYFGKPVTVKLHVRQGDLYGNSFSSNTDTILTTNNTYDKNGNVATTIRPDNVVITYTYDNLNRQTGMSMPGVDENNTAATIATSTAYDWAGKVLTQTDANGHTTTNVYDKQERLIKVSDALGYTSAYYYDRAGRLIAEVDKNSYSSSKSLSQMNRTLYTYDAMDRMKTKSSVYLDPVSSQTVAYVAKAFKYDAKGNLIKELDALGFAAGSGASDDEKINSGYGTQYTYDPANRQLTVLDPVNKDRGLTFSMRYCYDGAGRKISETNAINNDNNIVTTYTYDDANNLLTTVVGGQLVQTNTYDLTGNLLSQTDGNGNTINNQYNAWNMLKQTVLPGDTTIPASTITCQYDVNGNLKQKSNSAGVVDLSTYDKQGRELSHTQRKSDGTQSLSTSVRYDKAGNMCYVVDGNGATTKNTYNSLNKLSSTLLTVTRADNSTVQHITNYGYDKNGNQTTTTNLLGAITIGTYTNVYDPLNRLIEKKDPLNKSIEKLAYNKNNSQIASVDALNKTTQFTYDKDNRLLSTIDPLNHTKSQTYDNLGNIRTKTDGNNNITTFSYDNFKRLIAVLNAKNETTGYSYDANGNMLTQTDGANHTTTYEYNVANKLTKKIDHGGRTGTAPNYTYNSAKTERYTYDALGNLLTKLDRNGNTTTCTYDVHNRLLSRTVGTLSVTFTYDGNGNQLTMTDSTGITTRTYDALNRTKTKTVPGVTGSFTFLYDVTAGIPVGQVAEIDTDPKGNATTQVFDKAGRMISVTAGGNTTTYTYYDNGSKKTVLYPGGNYEEYAYYADGLLKTLVNKKANQTVIDSYLYTYDAAHNLTAKVDGKGTTTYTYDTLNRLLTVTEPGGKVTSYTFDAAGNRASQTETQGTATTVTTYTYNEQNRLMNILAKVNNVTSQTVAYTYDNNGNEKIITKVPYINGIVQTAEVTTCTYDKFNQLSTTATPDGTNVANTYNGEGLRVAKKVNGATTKYLYNGDKVVLELDGSNSQTARNVLGTNLISRTVSGTTLYYMYNGHADVTALVDAGGTIQATYYYDAFGNVEEQTGNFNNNILYAGYQYDKETGLYYCNSRMYDPVTARFLQEDTYYGDPNDPLSLNLYTYCHNEPLMYIDLTGHDDAYVQYNMEHYGSVSDISEQDTGTYGNDYDVATALKAGLSYNGQTGTITVWNESEKQFYYISYDLSNAYVGGTVNATITNAGTGELFRGYAVKLGNQKAAVNIRELGSYGGYDKSNVQIIKSSSDVKSDVSKGSDASESPDATKYVVKSGDSLSKIAQDNGTTVDAIAQANGISNPDFIYEGQKLVIPGTGSVIINLSKSKYPEAARHIDEAIKSGLPNKLTIDRNGAQANRAASLKGYSKVPGMDLDEYPPAMFKEGGEGASVKPINSSDNRGAGAYIGNKLRKYPDGTKVTIAVDDDDNDNTPGPSGGGGGSYNYQQSGLPIGCVPDDGGNIYDKSGKIIGYYDYGKNISYLKNAGIPMIIPNISPYGGLNFDFGLNYGFGLNFGGLVFP